MTIYYLDTSAFLKRYRTEKGTSVVTSLFSDRKSQEALVTSHFTSIEMESVAARALKGRLLNKRTHGVLLGLFGRDLEEFVIVLPVSTSLVSAAAAIAGESAVKAADAVHVASALMAMRSGLGDVVFVTSDKELLRATAMKGLTTLDPEAADAAGKLEKLRR